MNTPSVKSFHALRNLNIKLKRDDSVQISKAGGFVKARFRGRANFTFGATPEEAKQRLFCAVAKRWGITRAPITPIDKLLRRGLSTK